MYGPHDDGFEQIVHHGMQPPTTHPTWADPAPYGTPTGPTGSTKTGLTTRGKAALGLGAAVLAGGTLIGYQSYSASTAQADLKAQELALKAEALEVEKLKALNQAKTVAEGKATEQATARQTAVDSCVKGLKDQVGKGYGAPTYGDIVEDCQAQYPAAPQTPDMQAAGASNTSSGSTGGGINDAAVLGIGALVLLGGFAVRRNTRPNPA
ncbi:hypothetical protein [Streptomyces sp. DH8]|uniref:hypothetical protein n=1 Tax=Streptomyces sp. DH8 TaxID=2857008 RepID=UPI001E418128|nr:hypothetical protein [Streptomyces sp. DH8]